MQTCISTAYTFGCLQPLRSGQPKVGCWQWDHVQHMFPYSLKVLCTMPFTVFRLSYPVAPGTLRRRRCRWNRSWSQGLTLTSLEMAQGWFLLHLFHLFLFVSQECVEMMSAYKTFWNLWSFLFSFVSPWTLAKASSFLPSSKTTCWKSAVCTGNLSTECDLPCIGKEKMCHKSCQRIHTLCWCNAGSRRDVEP